MIDDLHSNKSLDVVHLDLRRGISYSIFQHDLPGLVEVATPFCIQVCGDFAIARLGNRDHNKIYLVRLSTKSCRCFFMEVRYCVLYFFRVIYTLISAALLRSATYSGVHDLRRIQCKHHHLLPYMEHAYVDGASTRKHRIGCTTPYLSSYFVHLVSRIRNLLVSPRFPSQGGTIRRLGICGSRWSHHHSPVQSLGPRLTAAFISPNIITTTYPMGKLFSR